ncbi:MAG: CBS domain-containing protein [Nitrospiraceae bacterium]|nr:CBS domain-containing protein [Nitrospiraceae bacterium]
MPLAREIMKQDMITVSPEITVEELGRIFIGKNISGAPVTDKEGNLYGIVTENDLVSQDKRLHIPTLLRLFDAYIALEPSSRIEKELKKMSARTVGEICTRDVLAVKEDTPMEDVATIMAERRINLVPVVKGKKLVGIIGRQEIIRAAMGGPAAE